MPNEILDKIKYLCKQIAKVEWSGILFYSIEGSIKDPENMVITLEDILPMHKGSATYTEYSFDERVVEYMMDNPESDEWKMGHIHSHNTMGVYFSGTDWSELEDNTPNHNLYLSLIVNNFMDFCAKVAFIVESSEAQFNARDEKGDIYSYSTEELVQKKLVTYDCNIISNKESINVPKDFSDKVTGIIDKAAAEEAKKKAFNKATVKQPTTHVGYNPNVQPHTVVSTPRNIQGFNNHSDFSWDKKDPWGETAFNKKEELSYMEADEELKEKTLEEFTMFVVANGDDTESFNDLDDLAEYYKTFHIKAKDFTLKVVENYASLYSTFFNGIKEKETQEMFVDVLAEVVLNIDQEYYISNSPYSRSLFLELKNGLSNLLNKFKIYGQDQIK